MGLQELADAIKARLEGEGYSVRLAESGGGLVLEFGRGLRLGGRVRLRRSSGALIVLAPQEVGGVVEEALASPRDDAELVRRALNILPVDGAVSARLVIRPELRDGSPEVAGEVVELRPIAVGIVKRWVGDYFVAVPILLGDDGRARVCRRCRLPLALSSPGCVFCGEPHGVPITLTAKITSR